jgi:predicted CXXCH cytochrome family protein
VTLPSGEILNLTINPDHYSTSVHGSKDITCVTCHADITGFPHPPLAAQDLRDVAIQMSATCEKCHTEKFQLSTDSVHHQAMAAGNKNAAVCSDCHEPHTQPQVLDPQTKEIIPAVRVTIPQTCARCHNAIYEEYESSVHGSALQGEGNPDVPTCTDCHGAHKITDPTTAEFRLNSPELCAKCHTDEQKMAKYGLSTDVLETYVADFHGTTVTLFQKQSPDQPTNKPVCYDCHGVHDIAKISDPQKGLEVKENLLQACQRCHPDATTNFPTSWLSHYIPSPTNSPLVYYVQLFYKILIPTVIGGMVFYVMSDFIRRLIDRSKGASH